MTLGCVCCSVSVQCPVCGGGGNKLGAVLSVLIQLSLASTSHCQQNGKFPEEKCPSLKKQITWSLLVNKMRGPVPIWSNFCLKRSVLSGPPLLPLYLAFLLNRTHSDQHLVHHTDFTSREEVWLGAFTFLIVNQMPSSLNLLENGLWALISHLRCSGTLMIPSVWDWVHNMRRGKHAATDGGSWVALLQ